MTLCSYCHCRPRRPGSPYCCDAHDKIKREQNRRNMSAKRQRDREAEQRETQRVYQHAQYMKRRARRVLYEPDKSFDYRVTVTALNLHTMQIERVKL